MLNRLRLQRNYERAYTWSTSLQHFNSFVWGLTWLLFKRGVHPDKSAQVTRTTQTHEPNRGVSARCEKFDDQGQTHVTYTNAAIYLRPSGGTKWCNRLTSQGCGTKRGLCLLHTPYSHSGKTILQQLSILLAKKSAMLSVSLSKYSGTRL
jgi:hypothetical protein